MVQSDDATEPYAHRVVELGRGQLLLRLAKPNPMLGHNRAVH